MPRINRWLVTYGFANLEWIRFRWESILVSLKIADRIPRKALTVGDTLGNDSIPINLESAWSGGPFQPGINYTGGNPVNPVNPSFWQEYRDAIWQSANGTIPNIDNLMEEIIGYGSFAGLGSLDIVRTGSNATGTDYIRWLDLEAGVSGVQWTEGRKAYSREYLCSNPSKTCIVHQQSQSSTTGSTVDGPGYTVAFTPIAPAVTNFTCSSHSSGVPVLTIRGVVPANPVTTTGMIYEIQVRIHTTPANLATCSSQLEGGSSASALSISPKASGFSLLFSGNTDFSLDADDAKHGYSYKGADPHGWVEQVLDAAETGPFSSTTDASTIYTAIRRSHDKDYAAFNDFKLDLGGGTNVAPVPTDQEIDEYVYNVGNRCLVFLQYCPTPTNDIIRHLETLLFTYGRYLLFSSSRSVLPANLQGKWGPPVENAWGADYRMPSLTRCPSHWRNTYYMADSNINIQMNYWSALSTFPSTPKLQEPLFEYIAKNWAPRGAETAKLVYGIERGWVAHNQMNVSYYSG
jgi:alpha-L-fucosidase 2